MKDDNDNKTICKCVTHRRSSYDVYRGLWICVWCIFAAIVNLLIQFRTHESHTGSVTKIAHCKNIQGHHNLGACQVQQDPTPKTAVASCCNGMVRVVHHTAVSLDACCEPVRLCKLCTQIIISFIARLLNLGCNQLGQAMHGPRATSVYGTQVYLPSPLPTATVQ